MGNIRRMPDIGRRDEMPPTAAWIDNWHFEYSLVRSAFVQRVSAEEVLCPEIAVEDVGLVGCGPAW